MISRVALRALLRFEIRQLSRHPGRSWLVALLIAVPVAAVVGGSTLLQITEATLAEQRAEILGSASIRVLLGDAGAKTELTEQIREMVPPDARIDRFFAGQVTIRSPGRRMGAKYYGLDADTLADDGLARGLLRIRAGRAPATTAEVALSPGLLRGLAVEMGGRVALDPGTERTVVGVVVDPEDFDMPVVLSPNSDERPYGSPSLLIGPTGLDGVSGALREQQLQVVTREEIGHVDGFMDLVIFVVGGLGFVEAALIIAAAFAVSFRRRQREIGLLGSVGATRSGLAVSMLGSSAALAIVGCVIGILVGLAVSYLLHPHLDEWSRRWNGPFEVSALHISGSLVLGVLTAVMAAAIPARSATRLPIRVALSGRRPIEQGSGRWLVSGLSMGVVGLSLVVGGTKLREHAPFAILSGGILVVLGLGACCPWVLQVMTRIAGPLPLPWRLAVRDAGRFRTRNGPVVAAVLAGMALSVMLAALIHSVEALAGDRLPLLRTDQIRIAGPGAEPAAADLCDAIGGGVAAPILALTNDGEVVYRPTDASGSPTAMSWIACGDESLLKAFGADRGLDAFHRGRLLILDGPDSAELEVPPVSTLELEGIESERVAVTETIRWPRFLISQSALETGALASRSLQAGLPPRAELVPWIVRLDTAVGHEDLDLARTIAGQVDGTSVDAVIAREDTGETFYGIVLLISFITSLIVIAIATSLSSLESAVDRRVLHAVGAAPGLMRSHLAARASYLAFLGCGLAVPAGCLPLLGLISMSGGLLEFHMPWKELAVAILGLPTIAYAATWAYAWITERRSPPVATVT